MREGRDISSSVHKSECHSSLLFDWTAKERILHFLLFIVKKTFPWFSATFESGLRSIKKQFGICCGFWFWYSCGFMKTASSVCTLNLWYTLSINSYISMYTGTGLFYKVYRKLSQEPFSGKNQQHSKTVLCSLCSLKRQCKKNVRVGRYR